ncbi:zinc-ribbon domain-containing protein [Roseobacter sp.]|uniref:zinc-ribbon domain-containing protein n=1 Tax=Roseobacter sp. TaxID=1907202 RepID=UPI002600BFCA|nr:zinc-ribbon domain-containing protein [Roseobacter sp.]
MRLICPNCDAQYEVPDEVIPSEGRDVQCSNCGQTWFQDHPDTLSRAQEEKAAAPGPDEEIVHPEDAVPDPVLPEEPAEEPKADTSAPAFEPGPAPRPDENSPARRRVDPGVASVLREEAELEATARRRDVPGSLESQPDLGLGEFDAPDEAGKRAGEARDRMARMRGETDLSGEEQMEQFRAESAAAASRRDLLPDIEEINSTLRSNQDRAPGDAGQTGQSEVREKRSSRRGFVLTVALFAILALIYVYAPDLSQMIPALEPALTGYTDIVDTWRAWLNEQAEGLLSWLDAAAVSSNQ